MTRGRLARLADASPEIRAHVDRAVAGWRGTSGQTASFDRLHDLLQAQNYRLAYWRTAAHEINYRRFFDVNDLAAIRMEEPEVFDHAHALVLDLIGRRHRHRPSARSSRRPRRSGRLRRAAAGAHRGAGHPRHRSRASALRRGREDPLTGELLLADWAVHGTTTYRFLNLVNSLFVDGSNAAAMRRLYARLTGRRESFGDLVYECKKLIMLTVDGERAERPGARARTICRRAIAARATSRSNGLRKALLEMVACFPAYRTYVSERGMSARDRDVIDTALARARRRNPALEATIFDFLRSVLLRLGRRRAATPERDPIGGARRLAFAMKFQQYTGPVHAKGVEDTAFYRHNVLVSLNEVGGDPAQFGRSPDEFHAANLPRAGSAGRSR